MEKRNENVNNRKIARSQSERAIFCAGCFWGVEAAFMEVDGVQSTTVGYTGGKTKNPTYEDICTDTTGHAEAVLIEYESNKVSYEKLLDVFWNCHNPTQLNRQGHDAGTQYRSAIFYFTEEQKKAAIESKEKLERKWMLEKSEKFRKINATNLNSKKIVTEILPAEEFYRAEEYHQKYLEKRGAKVCH